jgi:hypothetical protein
MENAQHDWSKMFALASDLVQNVLQFIRTSRVYEECLVTNLRVVQDLSVQTHQWDKKVKKRQGDDRWISTFDWTILKI